VRLAGAKESSVSFENRYAAGLVMLLAMRAVAQPIVVVQDNSGTPSLRLNENTSYVIGVPAAVQTINIYTETSPAKVLGSITFQHTGVTARTVPLKIITANQLLPLTPEHGFSQFGFSNIKGIDVTGSLRDWSVLALSSVTVEGTYNVGTVYRFSARMDNPQYVNLTTTNASLLSTMGYPGYTNTSIAAIQGPPFRGTVNAAGNIQSLDVLGELTGSISAPQGRIGSISTGDFSFPVYIADAHDLTVTCRDGIGEVHLPQNTAAHPGAGAAITVTANLANTAGTGNIGAITGRHNPASTFIADNLVGPTNTGGGDFYGAVNLTGNVTAPINQVTIVAPGSTPGAFNIGGSLLNSFTVSGGQSGSLLVQGNIGTAATPRNVQLYSLPAFKATNVFGNVTCKASLAPAMSFQTLGDLTGTLTFEQAMPSLVKIGGSITGSGAGLAVLPNAGLTGQIIVGANGSGSTSRSVTVGTGGSQVTLSMPAYTQTSASLGGGAVGVAPFREHFIDSKPVHVETDAADIAHVVQVHKGAWVNPSGTLDQISIQFYGPVLVGQSADTDVDPALLGLTVWYTSTDDYSFGTPVDVTSKFKARVPSGNYNRRIFLRPTCGQDYRDPTFSHLRGIYRVALRASAPTGESLRCRYVGTPGSEPLVSTVSHFFRFWCSVADLGSQGGVEIADGALDNNDFAVFPDMLFNHDPRADIGSQGGVYGSDGQWNNDDWVVFIDAFFAGCDATTAGSCPPGPGGAPAPAPGEGVAPPESMMATAQQETPLSESERQMQIDGLLAAYNATGDVRVLERLQALAGSPSDR
jgi:hypothetical protein